MPEFKKVTELTAEEICNAILDELANANLQQTASQITNGLKGILIPTDAAPAVFEELRQDVARCLEILKQEGKVINNANAEWDTVPTNPAKPPERKRRGPQKGWKEAKAKAEADAEKNKPVQPPNISALTIPVADTLLEFGGWGTVCDGLTDQVGITIILHTAPVEMKGILKVEQLDGGKWKPEQAFASMSWSLANHASDPIGRLAIDYPAGTTFRLTAMAHVIRKLFKVEAPNKQIPENETQCGFIICKVGIGQTLTVTSLILPNQT